MTDELTMKISGICLKNGEKCAYVSFSDNERYAEGIVPECRITKNEGFSDSEKEKLEQYMQANLYDIKARAAKINPVRAMTMD